MYRIEIDALNALLKEQQKTNALLGQLLARTSEKPVKMVTNPVKTEKRPYQRRNA